MIELPRSNNQFHRSPKYTWYHDNIRTHLSAHHALVVGKLKTKKKRPISESRTAAQRLIIALLLTPSQIRRWVVTACWRTFVSRRFATIVYVLTVVLAFPIAIPMVGVVAGWHRTADVSANFTNVFPTLIAFAKRFAAPVPRVWNVPTRLPFRRPEKQGHGC